MSDHIATRPYIYQPEAVFNKDGTENKKIYGISGPNTENYFGRRFTKEEAQLELEKLLRNHKEHNEKISEIKNTFIKERYLNFVKCEEREDGISFRHLTKKIFVITSIELKENQKWLHVSISKRDLKNRMVDVSWGEMRDIKEQFIGDRYAYIVFPPKENYVNIAQVFHLWSCLESENGKVLPEFSGIIEGLGRSI